jgi:uncharacterized protein YbcI
MSHRLSAVGSGLFFAVMVGPQDPSAPDGPQAGGDIRGSISRRIVQLHKEFYGRGPDKAKTYVVGDLVVVLMRGGFTRVEETLLREGRGDSVIQQRSDFQDVMIGRFSEVIEQETGRKVVAMMSGSHQHPDLLGEIFVLESSDVLADEQTPASGARATE